MSSLDLSNHFLIAMPTLKDPNFERTVTLLCAHNEDGAMGIVINRPTHLKVGAMLERLDFKPVKSPLYGQPVYLGGPVQTDWGLVLHRPCNEYHHTIPVSDDLGISMSRDIFAAIAAGEGPKEAIIALGYAGWGAGQLEQEIAENAWLAGPVDLDILFGIGADRRWQAAATLLGVDLAQISRSVGHA
jgi:putative transcriptional regulator